MNTVLPVVPPQLTAAVLPLTVLPVMVRPFAHAPPPLSLASWLSRISQLSFAAGGRGSRHL